MEVVVKIGNGSWSYTGKVYKCDTCNFSNAYFSVSKCANGHGPSNGWQQLGQIYNHKVQWNWD